MKTIYIWGGFSRNFGDLAIWEAQTRLMISASKQPLRFIPINSDLSIDGLSAPSIGADLIEEMNKNGHLLMIGAGGQLMPRTPTESVSGYQVNISRLDIDRIKIPICVFGVGVNTFPKNEQILTKEAIDHFTYLCKKSISVSVRDELSSRCLTSWGIKNHHRVSDPALFLDASSVVDGLELTTTNIGLNWAGDRIHSRYGGAPVRSIIDYLCDQLIDVLEQTNGWVFYFPHISEYDLEDASLFSQLIGSSRFINIADTLPGLFPERPWGVPYLAKCYSKMSIVLGTRWHSCVIPYGQGVPCVSYGATFKNKAASIEFPGTIQASLFDAGLANSMINVLENRTYQKKEHQYKIIEERKQRTLAVLTDVMEQI